MQPFFMCVYIYIYIYTHTHTNPYNTHKGRLKSSHDDIISAVDNSFFPIGSKQYKIP